MSLVPSALSSKIILSAENEITRCGGYNNFNPSLFNKSFYIKEIYNYIKDSAQISAVYSGVLPNGAPDPLNGIKYFKISSVGNNLITQEGNSFPSAADTWWNTLITSILITSDANDTTGIVITPFIGTPIPGSRPDLSNLDDYGSRESIWNKLSEEIINRVKGTPFSVVNASSASGGTGTCTFTSIL